MLTIALVALSLYMGPISISLAHTRSWDRVHIRVALPLNTY
jgi:hypothetical protein